MCLETLGVAPFLAPYYQGILDTPSSKSLPSKHQLDRKYIDSFRVHVPGIRYVRLDSRQSKGKPGYQAIQGDVDLQFFDAMNLSPGQCINQGNQFMKTHWFPLIRPYLPLIPGGGSFGGGSLDSHE